MVSLAETQKLIPYTTLQTELGLESIREVEDMIIEGISSGIVTGKLDQKNSYFEVDFVIGRDIQPADFRKLFSNTNFCCFYRWQILMEVILLAILRFEKLILDGLNESHE